MHLQSLTTDYWLLWLQYYMEMSRCDAKPKFVLSKNARDFFIHMCDANYLVLLLNEINQSNWIAYIVISIQLSEFNVDSVHIAISLEIFRNLTLKLKWAAAFANINRCASCQDISHGHHKCTHYLRIICSRSHSYFYMWTISMWKFVNVFDGIFE